MNEWIDVNDYNLNGELQMETLHSSQFFLYTFSHDIPLKYVQKNG